MNKDDRDERFYAMAEPESQSTVLSYRGHARKPIVTYDEKQAGAVLRQCVKCLKWWFMTVPQEVCISCR